MGRPAGRSAAAGPHAGRIPPKTITRSVYSFQRDRRRGHRVLDVVGAVLAALLAFTAVPLVLLVVVGNPLSGGLGHGWQPAPRDALFALAVAAWVAWAACCAQLVRSVMSYVRRGDAATLGAASILDRLAARIAVGVLALSAVGAPLALSSGAGAAPPLSASTTAAASASTSASTPAPSAERTRSMHTVRPGDTLWSIAEERLGDGADWTALARLNLGGAMGGGARFVDPDQLRAGWRLRLPAGTPPEDPHLTAPTPDGGGGRSGPGSGSGRAGQPDHLPELVALGLGSLACAALARRSRRRHRPPLFVDDLALSPPPSDGAIDTGVLLRHFDGVPALESFEAANYLLARALPGAQPSPAIRAACVSPSGVSFWLARRRPDAPDGFTAVMDGMAWQVDHAALDGQPPCEPHLPIAVPVGDDGEGTWLVTLARGSVLPVLGESAAALVRAGRDAVESWAWSDQVLVTDDPSHPRLHPSPPWRRE